METIYAELQRFQEWSEEEDPDWPNRSMRSDLRRLEHDIAAEARVVLQEYDDILRHPYEDEAAPNGAGGERAQTRRRQLRHRLDIAVQRMTALRGDLAAIIAVYAEGDRDFDKIVKPGDQDIRETLVETFAFMRIRSGRRWRSSSRCRPSSSST